MKSLYESILDDEESILDQGDQTVLALQWEERLIKSKALRIGGTGDIPTIIPISKDKFALKYPQSIVSTYYWKFDNKEQVDLLRNHCEYIEIPAAYNRVEISTSVDLDFDNLIKFRYKEGPIELGHIDVIASGEITLSNIDSNKLQLAKGGELRVMGRDTATITLKNVKWDKGYCFTLQDVNIRETENVKLIENTTYPMALYFNFVRCNVLSSKLDDCVIHHMLGRAMGYWNFQYSKGTVTIEDTECDSTINHHIKWDQYGIKTIFAKKQRILKWISDKYVNLLESEKIQNLYIIACARSFSFDTYKRKPLIKRYVLWSPHIKELKFKAWCDTSEDKDITWNQYEVGRMRERPAVSTVTITTGKANQALTQCKSNCALLEIKHKDIGLLFKKRADSVEDKNKIPQKLFEEYINFDNFPNLKYIVLEGMTYSLKRIDDEYWGKFE
jgi:hypothetical protein